MNNAFAFDVPINSDWIYKKLLTHSGEVLLY